MFCGRYHELLSIIKTLTASLRLHNESVMIVKCHLPQNVTVLMVALYYSIASICRLWRMYCG